MVDVLSYITARRVKFATWPTYSTYQAIAQQQTSATEYGDNYNEAVALLMLHMMEADASNGDYAGGQIVGAKEGQLELRWADAKSKNDDLSTTRWGRALEALTNKSIVASGFDY